MKNIIKILMMTFFLVKMFTHFIKNKSEGMFKAQIVVFTIS